MKFWKSPNGRWALVVVATLCAAFLISCATTSSVTDGGQDEAPVVVQDETPLVVQPETPVVAPEEDTVAVGFDAFGIEKTLLMPTALNTMIDFRYRVVDVDKAVIVLRRGASVLFLIDQKTGQELPVPVSSRVGPIRQTTLVPEVGRIYGTFFHNPAGLIRSGDRVTIRIQDNRTKEILGEIRDVLVD